MGIFSSKYVTTVGTTVSRGIKDKDIVPSSKTGLIAGLFGEEEDQLVEHVIESMLAGMSMRVERMYKYAKTNYPIGLPASKVSSAADGKSVVWNVLRTLYGISIIEEYYHFGPLNNLHVGWVSLVNTHLYNSTTNQLGALTAQKATPVYLEDMVIVVKDATFVERANGSLDQWGISANSGYTPDRPIANASIQNMLAPTPIRVDPTAANDFLDVTYQWEESTTTTVGGVSTVSKIKRRGTLIIPILGYDTTQDYFHVKYQKAGRSYYWLYRLGAGTHSGIDGIFNQAVNASGEYFPFIYFRQGAVSAAADKTTEIYKASKKMMKTLGIDYLGVIDAIEGNEDIKEVDQALMMFAVPANTTNKLELQYLFDFFNRLYISAGGEGLPAYVPLLNVYSVKVPRVRIEIKDSRLTTALSCEGVYKRLRTGVIGAVGSYTSSFTTQQETYTYTTRTLLSTGGREGDDIYAEEGSVTSVPVDYFFYRKQITETVYEEIQVQDLQMTYYMYGGHSTLGDNLEAILLVPLDRSITKHYSTMDKEMLFSRALHYIFNSRRVDKVKWYQQGWFADLITIIGIVITVLSFGTDGGLGAQLAQVAAGTLAIDALVFSIVKKWVIQTITVEAFKLVVKELGGDFALLVALVTAVYGITTSTKVSPITGAPWATELLSLSSNLSSSVGASVQSGMKLLQREAEAFNVLAKESSKKLDEIRNALDTTSLLNPVIIFGESPDDFYNRTIHAGNIGMVGIDSISAYVDIALTLPKINDTIESTNYA